MFDGVSIILVAIIPYAFVNILIGFDSKTDF